MTFEHTPGPWRAEANSDDAMVFAGEETLIADLYPTMGQGEPIDDEHERAANAKLIAAAPLLLDAVERALRRLNETLHGARPSEHALKYGEALRAALRAAGRLP